MTSSFLDWIAQGDVFAVSVLVFGTVAVVFVVGGFLWDEGSRTIRRWRVRREIQSLSASGLQSTLRDHYKAGR